MDKESRKLQKRGLFIAITKKQANEAIREENKKRKKEGKPLLSREEKSEIIEKIAKAKKREVAVRGAILAIGAFIGVSGTKLLDAPSNKGITKTESTIEINAIEAEKDIIIENEDKNNKYNERDIFINDIKVDLDKQENEIKDNLNQEINKLETKEEALDYVKDIYAKEYNEKHGTKISSKDISISKNMYMTTLKEDKAKNGDEIMREEYDSSDSYEKGIYTVTIKTAEGEKRETIARDFNDYCVRVYDSDEEVEKYEENTASEIGNIIMNGTDYAISLEADTDIDITNQYKKRLVKSITDYKEQKIDEIVKGKNVSNTNEDLEIE